MAACLCWFWRRRVIETVSLPAQAPLSLDIYIYIFFFFNWGIVNVGWRIQWTRAWANSGRWWRTEKPGVLQSMGSQRIGRNWVTEQQQQNIHVQSNPQTYNMKWRESCKVVSKSFVTPWALACQAPLSMRCSRQEYWSGLPCPPPGDLPYPGIKAKSLTPPALAGGFLTTSATWEARSFFN